jgi:hypothetical protein
MNIEVDQAAIRWGAVAVIVFGGFSCGNSVASVIGAGNRK